MNLAGFSSTIGLRGGLIDDDAARSVMSGWAGRGWSMRRRMLGRACKDILLVVGVVLVQWWDDGMISRLTEMEASEVDAEERKGLACQKYGIAFYTC